LGSSSRWYSRARLQARSRIQAARYGSSCRSAPARAISNELSKRWGQNVLVESRPGANGIIATDYVAKAPPDGYTVLMNDSAPLTINPFLYRKLPYDAAQDFIPVVGIAQVAFIMVASPHFAPDTLQQVFALAKARPGEINYASYGLGSSNHLETEALANQAGVQLTHVPYKGGADLMPALLAGQVQFALVGVAPVLAQIRQGRLKPIVYGATRRSVLLPEVPTISESGLPGYDSRAWLGWFLPAATPRPIADRIAADVGTIISAPEFLNKYITSVGLEPLNLPPEPFAEFVRAERTKNEARLKHIKLRLD
jgi:tripartite-type tricarboxylate transporter receptor subunit TctC